MQLSPYSESGDALAAQIWDVTSPTFGFLCANRRTGKRTALVAPAAYMPAGRPATYPGFIVLVRLGMEKHGRVFGKQGGYDVELGRSQVLSRLQFEPRNHG